MSTGVAKAKVDVPLARDQRADAGAVAVLRRLLSVIGDNIEGSISGEDPEHLHQLRIAVRRSRTVQRQLKHVFPPLELPGYRAEFRWLQQTTGDARDLDVYLEDLDTLREMLPEEMRANLAPLVPVLAHSRMTARAEMTRALRSVRAANLFEDWDRLLEGLVALPLDDRPAAARPIGAVAGVRIRKVYKRIVRMGRAIDADSPAQAYHDLRKTGKELRYLLELFGVKLFDEAAVTPLVRSLKGLQDVLGRHQDREIQIAMLRSAAPEVGELPGGGAACMAMGTLVERLRADEQAARDEFGARFAELAAKHQRALVRETFV
ncbi:MAG TPA: CHAD domain-containing protein [Solirubrobacteraceae bacterium]|jgi:CHAD domain-containing protein